MRAFFPDVHLLYGAQLGASEFTAPIDLRKKKIYLGPDGSKELSFPPPMNKHRRLIFSSILQGYRELWVNYPLSVIPEVVQHLSGKSEIHHFYAYLESEERVRCMVYHT